MRRRVRENGAWIRVAFIKKYAGTALGAALLLALAVFGITYRNEIWAVLTQQDARDADGKDDGVLGRGIGGDALPQERKEVDPVGTGDGGDGRHGQKYEAKQGADAAHPQRGHRLARLDSRCDGKGNGRNG